MTANIALRKFAHGLFRSKFLQMQELTEVYKPALNRGKERLLEKIKETAEAASKTEIARKMRVIKGYYTVEMAPPTSSQEISQLKTDLELLRAFFKSGSYKHLKVKEAWLLFLVAWEVSLWFYIGETIGKMSFVAYKV